MHLKIQRLNYGVGGGSADAIICGPQANSALDQRPYLGIHVGFKVCRDRPHINPANQELILLPGRESLFLLVGFITETPVPVAGRDQEWPHPSEYRNKLARLIANMVATSEIPSLETDVPTVLHT